MCSSSYLSAEFFHRNGSVFQNVRNKYVGVLGIMIVPWKEWWRKMVLRYVNLHPEIYEFIILF